MSSGFSGRLGKAGGGVSSDPQIAPNGNPVTVRKFLQSPSPTILPLDYAGVAALPIPQHMVGGSPFPHSAQTKLALWNRVSGGPGMPAGVTYNTPKDRMTQT